MKKYIKIINGAYGLNKDDVKNIVKHTFTNSDLTVITYQTKEHQEFMFAYSDSSLENLLFITKKYDNIEDYILEENGIYKINVENETQVEKIMKNNTRIEEIIYKG